MTQKPTGGSKKLILVAVAALVAYAKFGAIGLIVAGAALLLID